MGRLRLRAEIAGFEARLAAVGTRQRAEGEKKYLKSDLDFLGATTPDIRGEVKQWLRAHPDLDRVELLRLARALWRRPVHEAKRVATLLLQERWSLLEADDIETLESFLRNSGSWAYVDNIAVPVVGRLVERHPALHGTLDRWSEDDDFWIRRSAMLALLLPLRRGEGDWDRFVGYADAMLEEKEFFIRKATGWVLREVSKRRPDRVVGFLETRAARASGLTFREATKYLHDNERARLASLRE